MPNKWLLWMTVRAYLLSDRAKTWVIKGLTALAVANPVMAFAGNGNDIAEMGKSIADGAKTSKGSLLEVGQFVGLLFVIGGLVAAKSKKNNPQITVGHIAASIIFGALLIAVPEGIKRSQSQMGLTPVNVN